MKSEAFIELMQQAIRGRNADDLRKHAFALIAYLVELGYFPETLFDDLVRLLKNPDFHSMQNSFHLVKVLEESVEYLSIEQKSALLKSLEEIYPKITDTASSLILSELVSGLFPDRRSLETLQRLTKIENDAARALIACGLEQFAKVSKDPELVDRAKRQLQAMELDPSEIVRSEARESLARL